MIRFALTTLSLLTFTGCFEIDPTPPTPAPCDTGHPPECVDPDDEDVLLYVELEDCLVGMIGCTDGVWFDDACGCGCLADDALATDPPEDETCIDPTEVTVHQYRTESCEDGASALLGCDTGGVWFEDACGCGCVVDVCVEPSRAANYLPRDQCEGAELVGCDTGGTWFEDACGCGCEIE